MTSPLIDGVDRMHWSADGVCHGVGRTSGTGEPRIESHMTLKARCTTASGFFVGCRTARAVQFCFFNRTGFVRVLNHCPRGAVRSARHPVKVEIRGSNPLGDAWQPVDLESSKDFNKQNLRYRPER